MKRAFVIGHPIGHSRSPLIHGHWLKTYGIDGSYTPFDVRPDELRDFLGRIRSGEFVGGNVTVPHKEDAFRLVDHRDPETSHLGAFNTLVGRTGANGITIAGSNTDLYGFLANLDQRAPGWSEGAENAIVLGAGGAARAIVAALAQRVSGNVHVLNRTVARAEALIADLGTANLAAHALEDFAALAPTARLVVNTTTIGMHGTRFEGLTLDALPKNALVTDIVYVPMQTPLLAEAATLGLRTVDGLGMLLHQAVPGFEAWFGNRPEVTPELRAVIEATL
ncbi:shikimate dehydrogenase [Devosia sp.]|uniref:shikimate dehydrogenase n=1 Tax=Devosia sp. TaxID=1871048 RepID=UPI003A95882A